MTVVIDAAALMCVLLDEPGVDAVMPILRGGIMSTVNVSESFSRSVERGISMKDVARAIGRFELKVHPFAESDAWEAAVLRPPTKFAGCSLGDRACLALGKRLKVPIYTGDRRMASVREAVGIDVRLVR